MKKNIIKILCVTLAVSAIGITSVFASNNFSIEKIKAQFIKHEEQDLNEVATLLNITSEELQTKLQNGESLYSLLEDAGKLDEFSQFKLSEITEQFNILVADGKITQDVADTTLKELTEKLNAYNGIDTVPEKDPDNYMGFRQEEDLTEVANLLDITTEELQEKIKSGENIYTLLENADKLDEFKAIEISNFTESLNTSVADGKITQEEADIKLEEFTEKINSSDGNLIPPEKGIPNDNGLERGPRGEMDIDSSTTPPPKM